MSIPTEQIQALCFDYGNTLIELGPKQVAHQYSALADKLRELFGDCDRKRLKEIRDRQALAPFNNGFRENNLRVICKELIAELYGIVPEENDVDKLVRARYESFLEVVELPENVLPLLMKLSRRYRLSLLSNYPCSRSIQDSLQKIGLSGVFEAIVISADVEYIKPDARPFEALLSQLKLTPSQCLYIGDNWLADVQGSKRMGMHTIFSRQYIPYERFDRAAGDYDPDARISHLDDLEAMLFSDWKH